LTICSGYPTDRGRAAQFEAPDGPIFIGGDRHGEKLGLCTGLAVVAANGCRGAVRCLRCMTIAGVSRIRRRARGGGGGGVPTSSGRTRPSRGLFSPSERSARLHRYAGRPAARQPSRRNTTIVFGESMAVLAWRRSSNKCPGRTRRTSRWFRKTARPRASSATDRRTDNLDWPTVIREALAQTNPRISCWSDDLASTIGHADSFRSSRSPRARSNSTTAPPLAAAGGRAGAACSPYGRRRTNRRRLPRRGPTRPRPRTSHLRMLRRDDGPRQYTEAHRFDDVAALKSAGVSRVFVARFLPSTPRSV